jgi:hypothetical protein
MAPFDPSIIANSNVLLMGLDSSGVSADQTDFPLTVALDTSNPLHKPIFEDLEPSALLPGGGLPANRWETMSFDGSTLFPDIGTVTGEMTNTHVAYEGLDLEPYLLGADSNPPVYVTFSEVVPFKSIVINVRPRVNYRGLWIFNTPTNNKRLYTGNTYSGQYRRLIAGVTPVDFWIDDTRWYKIVVVEGSDSDHHWVWMDGVKYPTEVLTSFSGLIDKLGYTGTDGNTDVPSWKDIQIYDYALTDEMVSDIFTPRPQLRIAITDNLGQLPVEVESWVPAGSPTENALPVAFDQSSMFNSSYQADKMFDDVDLSHWLATSKDLEWASWDYGSTIASPVEIYTLKRPQDSSYSRAPKDWYFQGSHNNIDWDTLDTVTESTGWGWLEQRAFTCDDTTTAYRYYRIYCLINNGDNSYMSIGKLQALSSPPGKAVLHTKIPSYPSSSDGEIRLLWDKNQPGNTAYVGDTGDAAAQNVWDDGFVAVYHMAQDPSGGVGSILDSTINVKHGTPGGSMSSSNLVNGPIGKAIELDGVNDYIATTSQPTIDNLSAEIMMQSTAGGLSAQVAIDTGWWAADPSFFIYQSRNLVGVRTNALLQEESAVFIDGIWQLCSLTYDSTNLVVYMDGVQTGSTTKAGMAGTTEEFLTIGKQAESLRNFFKGMVAEVRISNVARSADWIALTNLSLTDQLITWAEISFGAYLGAAKVTAAYLGSIPLSRIS